MLKNTNFERLVIVASPIVKTAYAYMGDKEADPIGDLRFKFATLLTHLSEVFGLEMGPSAKIWGTGLGKDLLELHSLIEKNERKFCMFHFSYHSIMVSDGSEIKKSDPSLLERFSGEFCNCKKISQYRSLRFEIATAALLTRNSISFKKRESPDFEFLLDDTLHYLECTSCYVTRIRFDTQYKLALTVKKKTKKKYCNKQTALLIDISNIAGSFAATGQATRKHAYEILSPFLGEKQWCSIILYTMCHYPDAAQSQFRFGRYDSPLASPESLKMLLTLFPEETSLAPPSKKETLLVSRLWDGAGVSPIFSSFCP